MSIVYTLCNYGITFNGCRDSDLIGVFNNDVDLVNRINMMKNSTKHKVVIMDDFDYFYVDPIMIERNWTFLKVSIAMLNCSIFDVTNIWISQKFIDNIYKKYRILINKMSKCKNLCDDICNIIDGYLFSPDNEPVFFK